MNCVFVDKDIVLHIVCLVIFGYFYAGTLPSTIGNLTSLSSLHLYGTNFAGTLPSEMGNMVKLASLEINYCYRLNGRLELTCLSILL